MRTTVANSRQMHGGTSSFPHRRFMFNFNDLRAGFPWMKTLISLITLFSFASRGRCDVRVSVQETNGLFNLNYQCLAGETVRSFALDVTVDRGQIVAVTNFLRGPSTAAARGYGIFPASFRDNIIVSSGSNANWSVSSYSPVAVAADDPDGTLPGLNSSGVTVEFGALWDPVVPASIPPSSGTLCSLRITQTANVTVAANTSRGGIIAAPPELPITPVFVGALIGPAILSATVSNRVITVRFQDGELESAPSPNGPWTGTGNTSGVYTQQATAMPGSFYRVHNH